MSTVDLGLAMPMSDLFHFPESIIKHIVPQPSNEMHDKNKGNNPVDILETPKEYIFHMDVPGLAKSDIQVTVEDENILVIRSSGKRKHDEVEEDSSCRYIKLERKVAQKMLRKFKLAEDSNLSAITAKCENGVLTVVVQKLVAPKPKTVRVAVS